MTAKPPEPFLARWSRRKREETDAGDKAAAATTPQAPATAGASPPAAPARTGPATEPPADIEPLDLAALPSIDSITQSSDIRAFLRAGVPAELTKAALRKAWTSDPAIRDFIGLAENQWDFTDPATIPGFGPLKAGEEVAGLVRQALGQALAPPAAAESGASTDNAKGAPPVAAQVHGIPDRNEGEGGDTRAVEGQQSAALAAAQHPASPAVPARPSSRRTHGSARPK